MKPPIEYRPKRTLEGMRGRPAARSATKAVTLGPIKRADEVTASIGTHSVQSAQSPHFDRKSYQREYMRRYRAKKKTNAT